MNLTKLSFSVFTNEKNRQQSNLLLRNYSEYQFLKLNVSYYSIF